MTAILAWFTKDQNDLASLYLASDSLKSVYCFDERKLKPESDGWQKTFTSPQTADVFATFGNLTKAQEFLQNIIANLPVVRNLFEQSGKPLDEYSCNLFESVLTDLANSKKPTSELKIFHGFRFGTKHFGLTQIEFSASYGKLFGSYTPIKLTGEDGVFWCDGSGGEMIKQAQIVDTETDAREFSRWFWQTFHIALVKPKDPLCGGAPQLVGLYRKGNGQQLGIRYGDKAYIDGKLINDDQNGFVGEYRDHLFQRVDKNGNLLSGAQRHARNLAGAVKTKI